MGERTALRLGFPRPPPTTAKTGTKSRELSGIETCHKLARVFVPGFTVVGELGNPNLKTVRSPVMWGGTWRAAMPVVSRPMCGKSSACTKRRKKTSGQSELTAPVARGARILISCLVADVMFMFLKEVGTVRVRALSAGNAQIWTPAGSKTSPNWTKTPRKEKEVLSVLCVRSMRTCARRMVEMSPLPA